jgi:hypothetical protein
MKHWLEQNMLAAYGAVVGSVALLLNLVRFIYDHRKDNVRLRVSSKPAPDFASNAERMQNVKADEQDVPQSLPGYIVTVFNQGLVAAPLAEVGIRDTHSKDVLALARRRVSNTHFLFPVGEAGLEPLGPKSSQSFTVYLRRGQPAPTAKSCYVVDQTGKRWKGRNAAK